MVQPFTSAVLPGKYFFESQRHGNEMQDKFISKREAPFRDELEDSLFPSDKEQEFLDDPYQPVFYITEGTDSNDNTDDDDKDSNVDIESGNASDGNESGSESGDAESGSNDSEAGVIDDATKRDIDIKTEP